MRHYDAFDDAPRPSPAVVRWLIQNNFSGLRRGSNWYWVKEIGSTGVSVAFYPAGQTWHIATKTSERFDFRHNEEDRVLQVLSSVVSRQAWVDEDVTETRTRYEGYSFGGYLR